MSALDFDVHVERGDDALRVRVLRSPGGETATLISPLPADVPAPPPAPIALLPHGPARDIGAAAPAGDRRSVGRHLFESLLPGEALTRFRESQRRAADAGASLRIVLRTGPGVDELPWELLFDPERQLFIGLDPRTPIIRCIEMAAPPPPPPPGGAWRLLVVTASPTDLPTLDIQREVDELTVAVAMLAGTIDVTVARDCSPRQLDEQIRSLRPRVLHFIGHGSRVDGDAGSIQLVGDGGTATACRGADLARMLADAGTRLVVLNACHGAVSTVANPFAGPAAALVKAGVPAVIAMTGTVRDIQAVAWSHELYARLVAGADVDDAITAARRALVVQYGEETSDWPAAALYLGSSADPAVTASPMVPLDEDVRFTVSRPGALRVARWETMLVHAHRSALQRGPRGETIDPVATVRREVADVFGPDAVASTTADAGAPIAIGGVLRVVPDVPEVECDPPLVELTWTGEVTAARFQLRTPDARRGSRSTGVVRVYCGILLVAETPVAFDVVDDAPMAPAPASDELRRYQRIFPCFSPDDGDLVTTLAAGAELVGSRYTAGAIERVLDGAPEGALVSQVADADLFQLFWSSSSMRSPACRRQWEAALGLHRRGFVQAVYWERPFPQTADEPSPELSSAASFVPVTLPRRQPSSAPSGTLWEGGAPVGPATASSAVRPVPAPPPMPPPRAPAPASAPAAPAPRLPPMVAGDATNDVHARGPARPSMRGPAGVGLLVLAFALLGIVVAVLFGGLPTLAVIGVGIVVAAAAVLGGRRR